MKRILKALLKTIGTIILGALPILYVCTLFLGVKTFMIITISIIVISIVIIIFMENYESEDE